MDIDVEGQREERKSYGERRGGASPEGLRCKKEEKALLEKKFSVINFLEFGGGLEHEAMDFVLISPVKIHGWGNQE